MSTYVGPSIGGPAAVSPEPGKEKVRTLLMGSNATQRQRKAALTLSGSGSWSFHHQPPKREVIHQRRAHLHHRINHE